MPGCPFNACQHCWDRSRRYEGVGVWGVGVCWISRVDAFITFCLSFPYFPSIFVLFFTRWRHSLIADVCAFQTCALVELSTPVVDLLRTKMCGQMSGNLPHSAQHTPQHTKHGTAHNKQATHAQGGGGDAEVMTNVCSFDFHDVCFNTNQHAPPSESGQGQSFSSVPHTPTHIRPVYIVSFPCSAVP